MLLRKLFLAVNAISFPLNLVFATDEPPPLLEQDDASPCGPDAEAVFGFLLTLIGDVNSKSPSHIVEIADYLNSGNCSVTNLCHKYPQRFQCDAQGHLMKIRFIGGRLKGYLNLSAIPDTVTYLQLPSNKLTGISKWTDLKGKALEYLDIQRNPNLTLDLGALGNIQAKLYNLPLRELVVSNVQIMNCFGLRGEMGIDPSYLWLKDWIRSSTLDSLVIASAHARKKRIKILKHGILTNSSTPTSCN